MIVVDFQDKIWNRKETRVNYTKWLELNGKNNYKTNVLTVPKQSSKLRREVSWNAWWQWKASCLDSSSESMNTNPGTGKIRWLKESKGKKTQLGKGAWMQNNTPGRPNIASEAEVMIWWRTATSTALLVCCLNEEDPTQLTEHLTCSGSTPSVPTNREKEKNKRAHTKKPQKQTQSQFLSRVSDYQEKIDNLSHYKINYFIEKKANHTCEKAAVYKKKSTEWSTNSLRKQGYHIALFHTTCKWDLSVTEQFQLFFFLNLKPQNINIKGN